MTDFQMFGHMFQRARKAHTCWGCEKIIEPGENHWRCVIVVDSKPTTIRTCRPDCECIVDMLDQHQTIAAQAIAYPTFPAYMKDNPDAFKD